MPRSGWIACGAILGALALTIDDRRAVAAALALAAFGLFLSAALGRRRRRLIALVIGTLAILVRGLWMPATADLAGSPGSDGPWQMIVESIGSPRDGQQVATLRTLEAGAIGFRLAATLPRYPPVGPGDLVEVDGRTRPRPDSPYGQYLERIGAWGTLDARMLGVLERPTDPVTTFESVRRGTGDLLTRVLPEPEAGLAAGILIGLRDRVDRTVATEFTTAGVSHVVAISGWNIAIVAAAIGAMAGRIGRRRRSVVTVLAIVAYICFAGASASVLRAGAMAGVVLLARETGRAGRAAAALGWAAALLLFADPRLVADAGFQLSSLATAGLMAWASPLTDLLDRWTGRRLPRWLSESLGVSFAAQAATLPVVLASFGRLALIAPAVNLLVVPLVAPAMAAGIVALLGGAIVGVGGPPAIGAILAAPGWVALRLMIGIVDIAAALPLASVTLEPPWGSIIGAVSVATAAVLMAWRRRRPPSRAAPAVPTAEPPAATKTQSRSRSMRFAVASLVIAMTVSGAVIVSRSGGVARVTVLDVGQGDAILVEGSKGGRLLIDGGPDPDRLLVELDRRLPPWDRRIDALILSHPHEDHVAGLALLLDRYAVGRVFEPGMRGPGPGYAAWLDRVASADRRPRLSIAAGDHLAVDEIDLRVLWPIRGQVPAQPPDTGTGINNVSVVLLGAVGHQRFLLAGDVEQQVDPSLLAERLPSVDLLKVAHHGSRTATTEAFVSAVRPRVAVASAGTGNPYGHPAQSTLERLATAGARVYRTDEDGTVSVTFDDAGMSVRTAPRRQVASVAAPSRGAAPRTVATRRALLCDIPRQPFVPEVRPATATRGSGAPSGLGYHRADGQPLPNDRRCPALPPPADSRRRWANVRATVAVIAPLLYAWGDDELLAERLVTRFATKLEAEVGSPLERWDLRADPASAAADAAALYERLATPPMFGGGTLAVVANPSALVKRNDTRDRVVETIGLMAAGHALAFVEAAKSNAKGPGIRRLADPVKAAGGTIASAMAPRPTALAAWIADEARERGLILGGGAARELADRLGARVTEGDVERRFLSRIASGELDKLQLRHAIDEGPVTPDDVRALVARDRAGVRLGIERRRR